MKIRSSMVVHHGAGVITAYVLVEGVARDCAVYMKELHKADRDNYSGDFEAFVAEVGAKVPASIVDALPFRIPSDLTYRA